MFMKKRTRAFLAVACLTLTAAVLFSGCQSGGKKAGTSETGSGSTSYKFDYTGKTFSEDMKVGFVYVGPIGDYGYTYAHNEGLKYLKEKYPKLQTTYMESVSESDSEKAFEQLAANGCKVIFGTSYGYMDSMVKAAKKYPNVIFLHCSGYKMADNLGTYFNRDYQARYLTGLTAGYMTRTKKLGFIASYPTPEVVRNVDVFTIAARSVDPSITVNVVWTSSWDDPAKETTYAQTLISQGCDVLAMHVDSPAFAKEAEKESTPDKPIYAIGHDTDMLSSAPKSVLVGDESYWGIYYADAIKSILDKTWQPTSYWGGIKDGVIDISKFNDALVSKDVQDKVNAVRDQIIAGTFEPFAGPILEQGGKNTLVPKGEKASDELLLSINKLVEGINGTLPSNS